jgi:tRNA dimethylallyltransferase
MKRIPLLVLTGPTASGKSALACLIAGKLDAEIISVDSMKVYRRMDIGTAKPSPEMRRKVRFHLIDIREPWEEFNVYDFVTEAEKCIEEIHQRGKLPLLVGGTPLYLKGLLEGIFEGASRDNALREELYRRAEREGSQSLHLRLAQLDPEAGERIHPHDVRRIIRALEVFTLTGRPISQLQSQFGRQKEKYDVLMVGLRWPREQLYRRINRRVKEMFQQGLVEEVRGLLEDSCGLSPQASQALGYKEVIAHLHGEYSLDEAMMWVKKNTRRFSRKQMIWFKKFRQLRWLEVDEGASLPGVANCLLGMVHEWRSRRDR